MTNPPESGLSKALKRGEESTMEQERSALRQKVEESPTGIDASFERTQNRGGLFRKILNFFLGNKI